MTTKYTINTASLTGGTHEFKIKARTEEADYSASDFSNIVSYTKILPYLETPTGLSVINKTVSWNPVTEASGYMVEVNGISYYTAYTGMVFPDWLEGSTYSVRVQALGDDINYDSSEYTDIVSYTVPITLAVPTGLNISNKTLHWTKVSGASYYNVEVNGQAHAIYSTSYSLSVLTIPKTYTLKVKAIGDGSNTIDSDYSITVNYTVGPQAEDAVKPIINIEPNYVLLEDFYVWQGVFSFSNPNQSGVTIEYDYSWDSYPDTFRYSFNNVQFYQTTPITAIANSFEKIRTLYIHARIVNQNQYSDTSYASIVLDTVGYAPIPILPAPTISLDGSILKVTNVSGATSYALYNNSAHITTITASDALITEINLNSLITIPSTYYLRVKAISNGITTISSDYSDGVSYIMKVQLTVPSNPTISGTTFSWGSVSSAVKYSVAVRLSTTTSYNSTTTSFSLSFLTTPGTYYVKVKAVGNGTTIVDSGYTVERSYTVSQPVIQLAAPSPYVDSSKVLRWNTVPNASHYYIHITPPSGSATEYSTSSLSYSLSGLTKVGTYTIKVKATSTSTYYSDSPYSSSVNYTVTATQLSSPTGLTINGSTLSWSAVTNATGYRIYKDGQLYASTDVSTRTCSLSSITSVGTYTIGVQAYSTNELYTTSGTTTITYEIRPSFSDKTISLGSSGEGLNSSTNRFTFTQKITTSSLPSGATVNDIKGWEFVNTNGSAIYIDNGTEVYDTWNSSSPLSGLQFYYNGSYTSASSSYFSNANQLKTMLNAGGFTFSLQFSEKLFTVTGFYITIKIKFN